MMVKLMEMQLTQNNINVYSPFVLTSKVLVTLNSYKFQILDGDGSGKILRWQNSILGGVMHPLTPPSLHP